MSRKSNMHNRYSNSKRRFTKYEKFDTSISSRNLRRLAKKNNG